MAAEIGDNDLGRAVLETAINPRWFALPHRGQAPIIRGDAAKMTMSPTMTGVERRERSMNASAFANAQYWLSWIASARLIAAILVVAGVAIAFICNRIATPFEKTVSAYREQQLAALNAETVKLSAEAEAAKAQIATAQKETAQAQLQTERLRADVRGRIVSPEQWASLESSLKGHDLSLHIYCLISDPEVRQYALLLSTDLEHAGVKDTRISPMPHGPGTEFWGLTLEGPSGADFELLKSAFRNAKIDFIERTGSALAICVGNKPPSVTTSEAPLSQPPKSAQDKIP